MISEYKDGDDFAWIPVAKDSPRAFLPIKGTEQKYKYGYKKPPSEDTYFKALTAIQRAYINTESKIINKIVKGIPRSVTEYKAAWRHKGSLLGGKEPRWVMIPISEITTLSENDLASALEKLGTEFAKILPTAAVIAPVICFSDEELASKVEELRAIIGNKIPVGQNQPSTYQSTKRLFARDAAVVAYVLEQADGICECCKKEAPFTKDNGEAFLEVHHVKHLADNGSDTISNAVAVCPNCHRELHHGRNKVTVINSLYSNIARLVRE